MPDTDKRPRIPLTKPVDLAQLSQKVGTPLTASDTEVVVADPASAVTKAQLQAALNAYTYTPPPDPVAEFAAALNAVDTSKVTDPATKAALDAIKAVLVGKNGPGAQPRPGR